MVVILGSSYIPVIPLLQGGGVHLKYTLLNSCRVFSITSRGAGP